MFVLIAIEAESWELVRQGKELPVGLFETLVHQTLPLEVKLVFGEGLLLLLGGLVLSHLIGSLNVVISFPSLCHPTTGTTYFGS